MKGKQPSILVTIVCSLILVAMVPIRIFILNAPVEIFDWFLFVIGVLAMIYSIHLIIKKFKDNK